MHTERQHLPHPEQGPPICAASPTCLTRASASLESNCCSPPCFLATACASAASDEVSPTPLRSLPCAAGTAGIAMRVLRASSGLSHSHSCASRH